MTTPKLPPDMRDSLVSSGLPWRIETGGSHFKLFIGKKLVTILPKSDHNRMMRNGAHRGAMAYIRRAIKEQRR